MAWAQNAHIASDAMLRFYRALMAAGDKPEVHIFSAGRHGFSMLKQSTTSNHRIEEFYCWLKARGFTATASR